MGVDREAALALGGQEAYFEGKHFVLFARPDGTTLEVDYGPDGDTANDLSIEEIEAQVAGAADG